MSGKEKNKKRKNAGSRKKKRNNEADKLGDNLSKNERKSDEHANVVKQRYMSVVTMCIQPKIKQHQLAVSVLVQVQAMIGMMHLVTCNSNIVTTTTTC